MPTVRCNGLELAYEEYGARADPPMVMVMGLGVQHVFWPDELLQRLADDGFRVIAFDNRDVGLSSKLDHLGVPRLALETLKYALHLPVRAGYLISDMARDVELMLDELGVASAHVVGASMGGMIAQDLAAMAPGRVASLTSIMSTTGSRKLPGPSARAWRSLLHPPAPQEDLEGAIRRMMASQRIIGSRTYPAADDYLRHVCERHVRRGYHPAGVARQLAAIAASGDRTELVRRIRAPTLVIHGDEDPLIPPACGRATAEAIREGGGTVRLEIVHGMGHDLPVPLIPAIAAKIAAHCRAATTVPA